MAKRQSKIPRAMISVGLLEDPDFIALMLRPDGIESFGVFIALVVAAKKFRSQGKFVEPLGTLARMIYLTDPTRISHAAKAITEVCAANQSKPWLTLPKVGDGGRHTLVIRQFKLWNTAANWGGARDSAGRPPTTKPEKHRVSTQSRRNQVDSNLDSSCGVTETETETETEAYTKSFSSKLKGNGKAREAVSDSASGGAGRMAVSGEVSSDSMQRRRAYMAFVARVGQLWSPDAKQQRADRTCTAQLWNEQVWPEGIADGEGLERVKTLDRDVYPIAGEIKASGKGSAMAYLTKRIQNEWPLETAVPEGA